MTQARRPAEVVAAVRPFVSDVVGSFDLILWDVVFVREAGQDILRVSCDRAGGVGADDLAQVAEQLSRRLDDDDVIPGEKRYTLEVSSPGAERKVSGAEQFTVCIGRFVKLSTADGRSLEGTIRGVVGHGVTESAVEIETETSTERVSLDDIRKARLVIRGIG